MGSFFDIEGRIADIGLSDSHKMLITAEATKSSQYGGTIRNQIDELLDNPQALAEGALKRGAASLLGPLGSIGIGIVFNDVENIKMHGTGILAASQNGIPGYEVNKFESGDRERFVFVDASDPNNIAVYTANATDSGNINGGSIQRFDPDNVIHQKHYGEAAQVAINQAVSERNSVSDNRFNERFKQFIESNYGIELGSLDQTSDRREFASSDSLSHKEESVADIMDGKSIQPNTTEQPPTQTIISSSTEPFQTAVIQDLDQLASGIQITSIDSTYTTSGLSGSGLG